MKTKMGAIQADKTHIMNTHNKDLPSTPQLVRTQEKTTGTMVLDTPERPVTIEIKIMNKRKAHGQQGNTHRNSVQNRSTYTMRTPTEHVKPTAKAQQHLKIPNVNITHTTTKGK